MAGKFLEGPFGMEQGITQGDKSSPINFNIIVDTVVRTVLLEVCGPQEAHLGLGWQQGKVTWYSMRIMDGSRGGTHIVFRTCYW